MKIPQNLIHLKHYLVGDELIDCQHLDMVKQFEENKQDVPKAKLLNHARDLLQMWRVHIQCEEDLMLQIGYTYLEQHRKRHAEITGFFSNAIANVEQSREQIFNRYNVIANLQCTLMDHLDRDDQLLIPYIKAYRENKK